MNPLLSVREFYEETLKRNGFEVPAEDLSKVAAAKGVDVEIAKIAKALFEQTQLDGIQYSTAQERLADSLKIAEAFVDYNKTAAAQADKVANDIVRVCRHAVEGYLAHNGIPLDTDTAIKAAGYQLEEVEEKTASLIEGAHAALSVVPTDLVSQLGVPATGTVATPFAMTGGHDPVKVMARIYGHKISAEDMPAFLAYARDLRHQMGGSLGGHTHETLANQFLASRSNAAAAPTSTTPWGKIMLGGGAVAGLGALYLMHKAKKEREEQDRQRALAMSAALPDAV